MLIDKDVVLNVPLPSAVNSPEFAAWSKQMATATMGPSRNDNGVTSKDIDRVASVMHTNAIDAVAKSGLTGPAVDTAIIQEVLRQTEMAIDAYNRHYTEAVEAQQKKIAAKTSFSAKDLADVKAGVFMMPKADNDDPVVALKSKMPRLDIAA